MHQFSSNEILSTFHIVTLFIQSRNHSAQRYAG